MARRRLPLSAPALPGLVLSLLVLPAAGVCSEPQLKELLVSTTGGTTPLLSMPLGVSTFNARTLQVFGIDSAEDLAIRTPSLNIGCSSDRVSIRGVGQSDAVFGQDPAVAVYTDGVYNSGTQVFDYTNLFDVQRVEVLRGPQGTAYGRNTTGGAINLVSMAPTMTWQSKVIVEGGNYAYRVLQGLMSGPITDQLSMAVSGSTIERSGVQEDAATGDDFDDRDTQYLRASFKYHWNNIWYSRLQVSTVNDESNTRTDALPSEERERLNAYLLNEIALGNSYRLKYLAAHSETDLDRESDRLSEDSTSHDLKLYSVLDGGFNFVSGLYHYHTTSEHDAIYSDHLRLETSSMAAYGQANWDWTEQLGFSAGLRYSHDNRESLEIEDDWDNIDWRLGLNYQLTPGQMLYANLATGYRSGEFTIGAGDVTTQAPEDLLLAELGYKGSLLDERLHLTAAAYVYDYKDLQLNLPFEKAGSAEAWGLEVEAVGLLGKYLTGGGSWSYNQTKYNDPASVNNNEFPFTPDHKLNLYSTLRWPIQQADLEFTVNYMYRGKQYTSPLNSLDQVDSADRWDSRLSLGWGVWSLTAFVKNITDERSEVSRKRPGTALPNDGTGLTDPRTYGLRLIYQL